MGRRLLPREPPLTVPAHALRARASAGAVACIPYPSGDFPMFAAFIRFLEELLDLANFGNDISSK